MGTEVCLSLVLDFFLNWTIPWDFNFQIYNISNVVFGISYNYDLMIIIIFSPMALKSPPTFWEGRGGSPLFEMPYEFIVLENLGWVERHCTVCDPGLYK